MNQTGPSGNYSRKHHCLQSTPLQPSTYCRSTECHLLPKRRKTLQVQNALSRAGKEAAVEKLTAAFEESSIVFGLRFQGIAVKQLQGFRRSLPQEGSHMYVVKNSLLKIAADKVEGWSDLKPVAKGENAWVFANEDNVAACVKAFLDFEKELKADIPREKRAAAKPTDISGGVLDGEFLDYSKLAKLEKMPTKLELIRDAAVMIKKVPTRVAVVIKQVPTKLARAINLLAEGDENKDLLVGDVFPKAQAAPEA